MRSIISGLCGIPPPTAINDRRCLANGPTSTHPAGKADDAFITDAPLLNELLLVLSDFAQSDRYIFMNGVSDPKIGREWLKIRWEGLERATMPDRYMQETLSRLVYTMNTDCMC